MENKVISPCISICKTDPVTGYCYGCARTNDEKIIWKNENTTNEWKSKNLEEITKRMKDSRIIVIHDSKKPTASCTSLIIFLDNSEVLILTK